MIRRRHIIYVQGYDPRGLAEYYRMFRREYRKFCERYGFSGAIGNSATREEHSAAAWTVNTRGPNWQVETAYEFLRWEDIIRRDFERPFWWAVVAGFGGFLKILLAGVVFRIFRAHWRFGLFMAYPHVLLILWTLLAVLAGMVAAGVAAAGVEPPWPLLTGVATGAITFVGLVRLTERFTYMTYLLQDTASTLQYAWRERPDIEERLDTFARHVVEVAQAGAADEIIIVGHSSGSFLAVDVLARALDRDPELGRHGPRLMLLTVGGNLPIVGFQHGAEWFCRRIEQLAVEPSIAWVDYQSRRDIMNFFEFDPVAGHGIDVGSRRINPQVVNVQFRDVVNPATFAWLCWHFFSLHFQFLRANERPAAYDYFMIVAGPFPLATRVAMPREVTAAVAGDAVAARAAWDRLQAESPASLS